MPRKAGPDAARAAAIAILQTLRKAGHAAFLAGGCVRDELLGLAPTDYDIATDATPDRIRALFRRTNEVGAAFGVVLVTLGPSEGLPEQATVEVATFRSEGPYSDRRRPDSVSFSDPRADAARRDFTINALFLDPIPASLPPATEGLSRGGISGRAGIPPAFLQSTPSGLVIDFIGGLPDLSRRLIRAVGDPDARLAEDHLRALRAVRLAARLGFEIDLATAGAIHAHARHLAGVSRERIGEEVRKMFTDPGRARAVSLIHRLGLDHPVLTELPRPRATGDPPATPPWLPPSLSALQEPDYPTALAAWALDRGLTPNPSTIPPVVSRYRAALCLSNDETDTLRDALIALAALETEWDSLPLPRQKRLAGGHPGFSRGLRLLQTRDPAKAQAVRHRLDQLAQTPSGLAPPPLLTGDHLVAAGFSPGPGFKALLDRVYDAQLEDRISTPAQALELARSLRI
jgi:poly(A) polymerase